MATNIKNIYGIEMNDCKISGDIIVTDGTRPILSNSTKIGKKEFKPFDRVLVRQSKSDKWEAMLFSNYTSEIHRYRCGGMNYMFCIPYEGNEHLLGTTNDYKEE